ncbi:HPr family phosphocarrier protein [Fervidibacillus halotolerans]|uniref:HPr family phosphocarrier protein n=1 Tax=Fervidibacillus halotolerans TaxID=2980027 RepID=A0A9E8M093_9BACI|nr:HPr family phosphocarrier protein [Fervidibacillus halotolerans]WAA11949.1 HPr family phosphocarrier protein [Fervidibacillus halotolerans]
MIEKKAVVKLKAGLQARPAALFVQEANRFSSEIFIERDEKKVNAKSIMGIMGLAIASGSEVTIIADGSDEKEAVDALAQFLEKEE